MQQTIHIRINPPNGGVTLIGQILIVSRLLRMNISGYLVTNCQAGYKPES